MSGRRIGGDSRRAKAAHKGLRLDAQPGYAMGGRRRPDPEARRKSLQEIIRVSEELGLYDDDIAAAEAARKDGRP